MEGFAEGIAPTTNVTRCAAALTRVLERPRYLPGLAVFYGPSGWGKSMAARYAALRYGCEYVQARSAWNAKAFLQHLLRQLGVAPARTTAEMTDQAIEQIQATRRGLVLDEFDHLVARDLVELVRDLFDGAGVGMLLVGEEALPWKLRRWERFHGRVLDWVPAQPASAEDASALCQVYLRHVRVADDLVEHVLRVAAGSLRRVVVNLHLIEQEALREGIEEATRTWWGARALYVGEAPRRKLEG